LLLVEVPNNRGDPVLDELAIGVIALVLSGLARWPAKSIRGLPVDLGGCEVWAWLNLLLLRSLSQV
jgi:hypothetical protein